METSKLLEELGLEASCRVLELSVDAWRQAPRAEAALIKDLTAAAEGHVDVPNLLAKAAAAADAAAAAAGGSAAAAVGTPPGSTGTTEGVGAEAASPASPPTPASPLSPSLEAQHHLQHPWAHAAGHPPRRQLATALCASDILLVLRGAAPAKEAPRRRAGNPAGKKKEAKDPTALFVQCVHLAYQDSIEQGIETEVVAMVLEGHGTKAVKGTWPVTGDAFDHAVTLVTPSRRASSERVPSVRLGRAVMSEMQSVAEVGRDRRSSRFRYI